MSDNYIAIHPKEILLDISSLRQLDEMLDEIGFIRKSSLRIDAYDGSRLYSTGSNFINFLSKLYISKRVNVEYINDIADYVFVGLTEPTIFPHFLGANPATPSCPRCNHDIRDHWIELIADWEDKKEVIECQCLNCQEITPMHNLNWHKTGGFGQITIRIFGDVVPSQEFLGLLERKTGVKWDYFPYRL